MGKTRYAPQTRRFAHVPNEPCVYVAELSTGIVKIGATGSARARFMSLRAEAKREYGATLQRVKFVLRRTAKAAYEAETRVLDLISVFAQPMPGKREFFTDLRFNTAARFVAHINPVPSAYSA